MFESLKLISLVYLNSTELGGFELNSECG
jgi:hypothetical protein